MSPSVRSDWFQRQFRVSRSPTHLFQAGNDDRGSDLGFRRGADHLAVRGVYAVSRPSAGCPPTSSGAPTPPIIWKTPGRSSSAPRSISKPSTSCSRPNRWRWAPRFAARTCCRCCRATCGPKWSRRSSASRRKFKTGCITNNLPANAIGSHSGRSLYVAEVMVLFDHVIESAKIGLRKPDPRIYRMMVETLKVDPEELRLSRRPRRQPEAGARDGHDHDQGGQRGAGDHGTGSRDRAGIALGGKWPEFAAVP